MTSCTLFSRCHSAQVNAITIASRTVNAISQRSEEHTSELQSRLHLVCRLLLEKKNNVVLHGSRGLYLLPDPAGGRGRPIFQLRAVWHRRSVDTPGVPARAAYDASRSATLFTRT